MTWWTLTRKRIVPSYDHALITCRTSHVDHLYMAWAYHEPRRHPIWRIFRGRIKLCGYRYIWDTPNIVEQAAPGDTEHHQMQITNLIPGSMIFFYLFAPDGPYGLEIQGPLQYFNLPPGPPPPTPTPEPIGFTVAGPIFRCGNRYTFWANSAWYAMIPTAGGLEMHKLVAGVMMRQDQLHEPAPPSGTISDADSRLSADLSTIHCCYFNYVPSPGPPRLYYVAYNPTTDTWGTQELICTPQYGPFAIRLCSIAIDSNDVRNVVYTDYTNFYPELHHRHSLNGGWSDPMRALYGPYTVMSWCSLTVTTADNWVHLCAVSTNYKYWWNRYVPESIAWWDPWNLIRAQNIDSHSIDSVHDYIYIALTGEDWKIDHLWGFPPTTHNPDLTLPSSAYANMISGPMPDNPKAIVYRDHNYDFAQIYSPPGQPWGAETVIQPGPVLIPVAHLAHPDVISAIWTRLLPQNIAFYAWYAPWH